METKIIRYRGGLISFAIPRSWEEEYQPEGGAEFYEKGTDAPTFNLHVTTATPNSCQPVDDSRILLTQILLRYATEYGNPVEIFANGNALAKGQKQITDQGRRGTLYIWHLANFVPPNWLRIAVFTYAVPADMDVTSGAKEMVAFFDNSIQHAAFSSSKVDAPAPKVKNGSSLLNLLSRRKN